MAEINSRAEKASTTLATMLDYLGLNAAVKAEEKDGKITLVTYSEEAGRIIGKKGQSLQSLELLLNRMVLKEDTESSWINIDVDGYSSGKSFKSGANRNNFTRRNGSRGGRSREYSGKDSRGGSGRGDRGRSNELEEEQLRQMALDAAKEVKRWGDSVTLKPMNSHDRRIIHMTLKEEQEIETISEAVGNNDKLKKVIVSLKKNAVEVE